MPLTPSDEPWLRLALCPGLSNSAARQLVARTGSPADAVGASAATLRDAGLAADAAEFLRNSDNEWFVRAMRWLEGSDRHLLTPADPRMPPLLIESGEAPLCLFVEGDPNLLSLPQLAIVGSRKATAGGMETAGSFARYLASAGLIITSGLAEGIDAAAHAGALKDAGHTIAVLGTGPDEVYPRSNAKLARAIAEQGALVTNAPGTPPSRDHFPRRNRIISGLSLGVLVVEAGLRSGSLITARYAGTYGREIFAVPGSIHSPLSKGCHRLIREGARLIESAKDIVSELGPLTGALEQLGEPAAAQTEAAVDIDPDYAKLLHSMAFDPLSINDLASRTGLTAEELSSMLLILEMEGRVISVPGGYFQQTKWWK